MSEVIIKFSLEWWRVLCLMSPWLLFGFLVAGILSVLIPEGQVKKILGKPGFGSILKAALLGVPLPLCSCGVIPVALSLRKEGASRGAVNSFLISTPQTGVDSIVVTYSMMGWVFALFRPFAAFFAGLFGGIVAELFDKENRNAAACCEHEEESCCCEKECCSGEEPNKKRAGFFGKAVYALHYGFVVLTGDVAGALLAGISIAALIGIFVPENWFGAFGTGFVSMLAMMALGIPMYVCSSASVPIAAAFMLKGISPGAALVFLMAGPGTNAATVSILWNSFGRRSALLYLISIIVSSLLMGGLLNLICSFVPPALQPAASCHELMGNSLSFVEIISGVFLLGLIFWRYLKIFLFRKTPPEILPSR